MLKSNYKWRVWKIMNSWIAMSPLSSAVDNDEAFSDWESAYQYAARHAYA